jgi:hypothetical protein
MSAEYIRNQIKLKKGSNPYFSTSNDAKYVITEFDHFPYTRFYRSVYNCSNPVVIEREAGWRPRRDLCYKSVECNETYDCPDICFQNACSTVLPCYTKNNK